MARNPKDLVVSYYQFHRSLRTMSYRGTFQEFCRRFMNDKRKCLRDVTAGVLTARRAPACPSRCPQFYSNRGLGLLPRWRAEELGLRAVRKLVRGRASARQSGCPTLKPFSLATSLGF